jgi:hypothetical protein
MIQSQRKDQTIDISLLKSIIEILSKLEHLN